MQVQLLIKTPNETQAKVIDIDTVRAYTVVLDRLTLPSEVVFELFNKETAVAPQRILAKRVENNLEITIEDSNTPNLIIENYYEQEPTSPIIGLAEDGQYYAYLPESGLAEQAIPELSQGVLASEVLGGSKEVVVTWGEWIWAAVGVATVAGGLAYLIHHKAQGKSMATEVVQPVDKPTVSAGDEAGEAVIVPGANNTKLTIKYTDENDQEKTIEIVKGEDGKWKATAELPAGVSLDSVTGKVTLPANEIRDNSEIFATGENKNGQAKASDETAKAGVDTPADKPTVKAGDEAGDVEVMPGANNIRFVIKYTDENNQEKTIEIVKDENGQWKATADLPEGVTLDPITGKVTLPAKEVKDNTTISATGDNGKGIAIASDDTKAGIATPADKPMVNQGEEAGSLEVSPGANNIKFTVKYIDENDQEKTIEIVKGADGKWKATAELPAGVTLDPITGKLTLPANEVKDNTPISTLGENGKGPASNASGKTSSGTDTPADKPTVKVGEEAGSVEVTPGDNNIKFVVKYTDEHDQEKTIEIVKGEDGKWKATAELPEGVTVDPDTGKVTLPANEVKDNTPISTVGDNGKGTAAADDTVSAGTDTPADKPSLKAGAEQGSVEATPGANNNKLTVKYTDEQGQAQTIDLVKDEAGNWSATKDLPADVSLDPQSGKITLSPNLVNDKSLVSVTGDNGQGEKSTFEIRTTEDKPADQASLQQGSEEGSVIVRPGADNTKLTLTFTDENGTQQNVIINKDADNRWTSEADLPAGVTFKADGTISLEPNAVRDRSKVTAISENGLGDTETAEYLASSDKPADKVTISAGEEAGSVVIAPIPNSDNTRFTVSYLNENNQRQNVVVTKGEDGWRAEPATVSVDQATGKVTLSSNEVKDGTPVTATSENGIGAITKAESFTAGNDTPATSPTIKAGSQAGSAVISPGADNTKVTVTYLDESNQKQSVIVMQSAENRWTAIGRLPTGVTIDENNGTINLSPNAVKDRSKVTAIGDNGLGATTSSESFQVGNDKPADQPTIAHGSQAGAIEVRPGSDNIKLVITYTDENNQARTLTLNKVNDVWTSRTTLTNGIELDPASGKVTLPPNAVADSSSVNAKAENGLGEPTNAEAVQAGTDKPADPPVIVEGSEAGAVSVTPGSDNNKVTISYTDENNTSKTITLVKGRDDQWNSTKRLPADITLNSATGQLDFAPTALLDGSIVNATGDNGVGATPPATAREAGVDKPADQPTIIAGQEAGSMVITAGADNIRLVINYLNESNQSKSITLLKGEKGWTTHGNLPAGATADLKKGSVTLTPNEVKDQSEVTAIGDNGKGATTPAVSQNAGIDKPADPASVTQGTEAGSVIVTPGADNTKVIFSYTDESNLPKAITLLKEANGNWRVSGTTLPADASFEPTTGKLTLKPNHVKDGTQLTAISENSKGLSHTNNSVAGTDKPADPVTFADGQGDEAGAVSITPGADNTLVIINYDREDGRKNSLLVIKNGENWTIPNKPDNVSLDPATGLVTLTPDAVKDGSTINVSTKNGVGADNLNQTHQAKTDANFDADPVTFIDGTGIHSGAVTVVPASNNNSYVVTYTQENGRLASFTVTKTGSTWTSTDKPNGVELNPTTGEATLTPNELLDGSAINVVAKNGRGADNVVPAHTAGTDAPANPVTFTDGTGANQGQVTITPGAENTVYEVSYQNEDNASVTFSVIKNGSSWYSPNKPTYAELDLTTGVVVLPPNEVKDGSQISVTSKNGVGDDNQNQTHTAPNDDPADAMRFVNGTRDKVGGVTVTPGKDNIAYTIEWEREDNTRSSLTVTKIDGKWVTSRLFDDVTLDPTSGALTFAPDAVKDGSKIRTTARNDLGADDVQTHNAPVDVPLDPADPVTFATSQQPGAVIIKPGKDNTAYVVNYIKEDDTPASFTVTKTGTTWAIANKPADVTLNATNGNTTLLPNAVKDTSLVSVDSKNGVGSDTTNTTNAGEDNPTDPINYEHGTGANAGGLTLTPGVDNIIYTVTYNKEDGTEANFTVKKVGNQWGSTDKPDSVTLDQATGVVTMPPSEIKDYSLVYVTSNNGMSADSPVLIFVGKGAPPRLEVSLAEDTGSSSTDNYTKNPKINVSNIPSGREWQYTTDGGYTWADGVIGQNSFILPENYLPNGKKHYIRAKLKGQDDTLSPMLTMVYDHVAPTPTIAPGASATGGAYLSVRGVTGRGDPGSIVRLYSESPSGDINLNKSVKVRDDSYYALLYDFQIFDRMNLLKIRETDLAGNEGTTRVVMRDFINLYKGNRNTTEAEINNLVRMFPDLGILLSASSTNGGYNGGNKNQGGVGGGASVDFGGGNDSLVQAGTASKPDNSFNHGSVSMGDGNDYVEVGLFDNGNYVKNIDMGNGNDLVFIKTSSNQSGGIYTAIHARTTINLGAGDDVLIANLDTNYAASRGQVVNAAVNNGGTISGGEGFDSLVIYANDRGNASLRGKIGNWSGITGFERFMLKSVGTSEVLLELNSSSLSQNNSATLTDDKGRTHQKVLVVQGESADSVVRHKVSFTDGNKQFEADVVYENKTYKSYSYTATDGNIYKVWVNDVTVL